MILTTGMLAAVYGLLWLIVYNRRWTELGFGGLWTTGLALIAGELLFLLYDRLLLRLFASELLGQKTDQGVGSQKGIR